MTEHEMILINKLSECFKAVEMILNDECPEFHMCNVVEEFNNGDTCKECWRKAIYDICKRI